MARWVMRVAGEPVEGLVQRDRIGRRQRAVGRARRGDHAERAEARGSVAERGEELAHEIRDRALAARAGHRDDGLGLAREEPRRRERQRAAHIGDAQIGDGGVERRRALGFADDRHRAGGERLRDEGGAVGLGPGHGDEHRSRAHLAAVGGQPGDGAAGMLRPPRLRKEVGEGGQAAGPTLMAVIPGLAEGENPEPINTAAGRSRQFSHRVCLWVPGSRCASPGMTGLIACPRRRA